MAPNTSKDFKTAIDAKFLLKDYQDSARDRLGTLNQTSSVSK